MCLVLFCQNRTTDKAEMSAGNMSSSQFATEAVVMPTEQNHLSLPGRSIDKVSVVTGDKFTF